VKRVLIIDDSTDLVALLKLKLAPAGFDVRGAFDGMYGMTEALRFTPDLIILDLNFPAGGGISVLARLKANLLTKSIPVLILTDVEDEDIEKEAFHLGAGGYLLKPAKPEEVIDAVQKLVTAHTTRPEQ
jgi:two-component system chemotaxis response regulator CheY